MNNGRQTEPIAKLFWQYLTKKNPRGSPLMVVGMFVFFYGGMMFYEIFKPDFYVDSVSSRLVPAALWLAPPAFAYAIIANFREFLKTRNNGS